MFKKFITLLLTFALILGCMPILISSAVNGTTAKSLGNSNPLMDYKYGADPYALVYNGRVYIYMSADSPEYDSSGKIKDNDYNEINKVNVISSADMVNWTDHGAIPVAGANNANNGKGIAKWASFSWAPSVAHKVINGKDKFFLYFANSGGGIGVLTADSPIGPWSDPIGKVLVSARTPGFSGVTWLFDPAVLVDDDGTGYLYCGGGIPNTNSQSSIANPKTARVIKLGSDMTSTVGSGSTIDAPFMFEDSGIHKYNGKYYYSYCINFSGTHPSNYPAGEIGYMTSSNPMGPFTYKGHFLKNPGTFFGVGGNNHHAVFKFNNQWYVVYHAQTLCKAIFGTGHGYRSPHINKLFYNSDGSIQEVKGDLAGISQIANLDPYQRNEAETIGWNAGITTESCQSSGGPTSNQDVTSINNHDWIAVGDVNFGVNGAKSFQANVASTVGGNIEIRLDSASGTLIGTLPVTSTGGSQNWRTVETNVSRVTGIRRLFFVFTGSGTNSLFNFDSWKFTANDSSSSSSTPSSSSSSSSSTPSPSSGNIKVQFYNGSNATSTATLSPNFKIVNIGSSAVSLADIKVRYYFTADGSQNLNFACDWSNAGNSNVTDTFGTVSAANADHYLEIGFSSSAGSLAPGASVNVNTRIWKSDWSGFNQSNDYSFNSSAAAFTDWTKTPGYVSGALQWGTQP